MIAAQRATDMQWPEGAHFGNPTENHAFNGRVALLHARKGADPSEWPEDLRIQKFPRCGSTAS